MFDEDIYPPIVEVNSILRIVRFFLGDRWIEIGKIALVPQKNMIVEVTLPDIDKFFEERQSADDGTEDWCVWGPRVN